MATTQKKSTSSKRGTSQSSNKSKNTSNKGKKSSTRKNVSSRKTREQEVTIDNLDNIYHDEIILIGSLVVSILLILSNFNLCGAVGVIVNKFIFGIFGFIAYFIPYMLFIGIAFHISNRGNKVARRKLISTISLFIVLTTLLQLLSDKNTASMKILKIYTTSSLNKSGGGIIGGILCKLFVPLFGVIGTYVILIAIMIVLIMFITERAFFSSIGKKGSNTIKSLNEKRKQYKESREENEYLANTLEENPYDSKVSSNEGVQTRQAKIFTLKKPTSEKNVEKSSHQNKLRKKREERNLSKSKTDIEMEEIIPFDIENIPIHRASQKNERDVFDIKNMPIYEEELKRKFENSGNDYDIQKLAESVAKDRNNEELLKEDLFTYKPEEIDKKYYYDETMDHNLNANEDYKAESYSNQNSDKNLEANELPHENANWELQNKKDKDIDVNIAQYQNPLENDEFLQNDEFVENQPIEALYETDVITNKIENQQHASVHDTKENDHIGSSNHNDNTKNYSNHNNLNMKNHQQSDTDAKDLKENVFDNKSDLTVKPNPMKEQVKEYKFPPIDLLTKAKGNVEGMSDRELKATAIKLQKTLESFGVRVTITNVSCGPSVTRYELQPEQGVKVSKITNLADDIKLNLAAADIRIEAPIPGKAAVGIEVPNKVNSAVMFRELIEAPEFSKHQSNISFAVGKDIGGQTVVTDIAKMPHLLIAGATGSGKSVCINTIIMSILYKANPNDVKLIMVDPKVVELSVYNGIPHLLIPVVTDPKKASAALNWAVMEMTERYNRFAELGVRDIKGYNEKISKVEYLQDDKYQKMPQIVIIVDELADLMMVAPGEVEDAICRLAQMARAAGLHLIIATQRPSVNVITGLIKANVPSRIAFSVSSAIDSRTILDGSGAEKLLGKGDMLFFPSGYPKPVRIQGAFVTDKEVSAVVEYLTTQNNNAEYSQEVAEKITNAQSSVMNANSSANDRDEYFIEAGKFIIEKDKASIGMLQRVFKIGFNRAARIMDQLSDAGVVGPEEGTKPRKVIMSMEEFEQYIDEYV